MRLIKITAPAGRDADVAKTAFACGIRQISVSQVTVLNVGGKSEIKEAIDIETSTPLAKRFVDALLTADFYDGEQFTINTRQPRSIISFENLYDLTKPLCEPATDILEELWQFSHITIGFLGRILIAGCLLAFGLIHGQTLIMIASLLFLPLLPLLLAVGFGAWTKQYKLAAQSLLAFTTAIILLFLSGAGIAAFSSPPLKYDEFNSLPVSLLISAAVGVAAGLASADDAGKRELIGLAAAAQIALLPVWFGICFIFGFPGSISRGEITTRAESFFLNISAVIVASLGTYLLLGAASRNKFLKLKSK